MDAALVGAFWDRVERRGSEECWEWTGYRMPPLRGRGPRRYGKFSYRGSHHYAHRLSFEIHFGRRPELHVLHACDNMACVNPAHLREGTNAENARDRERRGRGGDRRGAGNNRSKLTNEDVLEMRRAFRDGESAASLARRFGVSRPAAWSAASGRSWRHLGMPSVDSEQTGEEIVERTVGG